MTIKMWFKKSKTKNHLRHFPTLHNNVPVGIMNETTAIALSETGIFRSVNYKKNLLKYSDE